jgi:branched-subunit amino acid ABC-type transport system permease component
VQVKTTRLTAIFLVVVVAGLVALLVREAASGPTFRAQDYDSYAECMGNIPREWLPNSLERQSAETACMFVHQRRGR